MQFRFNMFWYPFLLFMGWVFGRFIAVQYYPWSPLILLVWFGVVILVSYWRWKIEDRQYKEDTQFEDF
jgi:membrane protein DedA with SNARE-associated domain